MVYEHEPWSWWELIVWCATNWLPKIIIALVINR